MDTPECPTVNGMRQYARFTCCAVKSHQKQPVERLLFYPLHHRQAAGFALHQSGAGIDIFRTQIGHLSMAVCNHHFGCPTRKRTRNRGIHFLLHQTTGDLMLRVAG